jgi:hypothetical protein
MNRRLVFIILSVLAFSLNVAGKKRSAKPEAEVVITDSMKVSWNDSLKAVSLLAAADLEKGDSISAMNRYETVYSLATKVDNKAEIIKSGMYIGKEYIKTGKDKAAEIVLEQVFNATEGLKLYSVRLEASDLLAELFSARAFYIRANAYLKESFVLREKAAAEIKMKEETRLRAELDEQLKAREKQMDDQRAAEKEVIVSKDQYINMLLIAIGVLAIFILVLFFRIYGMNRSLSKVEKENELLLHNKKHTAVELERLHRLADESKNKRSENQQVAAQQEIKKEVSSPVNQQQAQSAMEDDRAQMVFNRSVSQRIQQIEDSLKKSDWQQIQRLIKVLHPQLMDAGMKEMKPLFDSFERMDGTTSYLTWHSSTKDFCSQVKEKLVEME